MVVSVALEAIDGVFFAGYCTRNPPPYGPKGLRPVESRG